MSVEEVRIRTFERADADVVCSLASSVNLSPWSAEDYVAELERADSLMLSAVKEDELIGFIVGRLVPSSNSLAGYDAEIYNIGVDPKHQRKGAGTALIRAFLEKTAGKNVHEIWLEVRAGNAAAIRFYEEFGFREVFRRSLFYRNPPDDGLVMALKLTETSG